MARGSQGGEVCCCYMKTWIAITTLVTGIVLFLVGFCCLIPGLALDWRCYWDYDYYHYEFLCDNLIIAGCVFLPIGTIVTVIGTTFYCMISRKSSRVPPVTVAYTANVPGAYPQAYPQGAIVPGTIPTFPAVATGTVPGASNAYPGAVPVITMAYPGAVSGVPMSNPAMVHQSPIFTAQNNAAFTGHPGVVATGNQDAKF